MCKTWRTALVVPQTGSAPSQGTDVAEDADAALCLTLLCALVQDLLVPIEAPQPAAVAAALAAATDAPEAGPTPTAAGAAARAVALGRSAVDASEQNGGDAAADQASILNLADCVGSAWMPIRAARASVAVLPKSPGLEQKWRR